MAQLRGTIKLNDQVLEENIPVALRLGSRSGVASWSGSFIAQSAAKFQADGPYRLELEDGRSGDILITNIRMTGGGNVVEFESAGSIS